MLPAQRGVLRHGVALSHRPRWCRPVEKHSSLSVCPRGATSSRASCPPQTGDRIRRRGCISSSRRRSVRQHLQLRPAGRRSPVARRPSSGVGRRFTVDDTRWAAGAGTGFCRTAGGEYRSECSRHGKRFSGGDRVSIKRPADTSFAPCRRGRAPPGSARHHRSRSLASRCGAP